MVKLATSSQATWRAVVRFTAWRWAHWYKSAGGTGRPTGYMVLPAQYLHVLGKLPAVGFISQHPA